MITKINPEILKTDYLIGRTIVTTEDDPKIGMIWKISNDRCPETCIVTFIDLDGIVHEIIANEAKLYK